MLMHNNRIKLMKESTVIPLADIARLSMRMEKRMNAIKNDRRESNELMDIRTGLNVLIRALLSLLHYDNIKSKTDAEIFLRLQENFGRMIKILDDKEEKIRSGLGDKQYRIMMNNDTLSYTSEIESILYGDIYYSIKRVLERKPKDAREFMYNLYEILSINVGIFGSEGRVKGKASTLRPEPSLTAKAMLSEPGQKKLEKDFDARFKGFDDLKIAESVFSVIA